MTKFDKIKKLQNDIDNLFSLIDKHKQTIDLDKLNILNELMKISKRTVKEEIESLFDINTIKTEDDVIVRLEQIRHALELFLKIEILRGSNT